MTPRPQGAWPPPHAEAERVAEAALAIAAKNAREVFNALAPALTLLFPGKKVLVRSFFRGNR